MPAPLRFSLTVDEYLSGVQVDQFLARHFRNYSTWRFQRMVQAGLVRIDHEPVAVNRRVFPGEVVELLLVEPPDHLIEPEPLPLDIIFEDAWIIVLSKPPGYIAHQAGDYQTGTLTNAVQHHLDCQTPLKGLLRPGIVHRLDRMTSGVMVLAKEHLSHRHLSAQFEQRRVTKSYTALVAGQMPQDQVTVTLPIGQLGGGNSVLMSARADALNPKPARTLLQVICRFPRTTLVKARPMTGRLHQIRVHLATLGFPVIGDEHYGTPESLAISGEIQLPPDRHLLHASEIGFSHPISEEWLEFHAPLADDFLDAVEHYLEQ